MPPNMIATGMIASGFWRARKAIRMPVIAVAGDQRRVGAALDRRHLEEAGEPAQAPAIIVADHDELADRQALRQRGARIAAGDAHRKAEGGARQQDVEHDRER